MEVMVAVAIPRALRAGGAFLPDRVQGAEVVERDGER